MIDQQIAAWVRHWLPGEYDKVAGFFPAIHGDMDIPPCKQAPWMRPHQGFSCDMVITNDAILLLPQLQNQATHGAWLASLMNPHRVLWQPTELWLEVSISGQRIDLYQSWKNPAKGIHMPLLWPKPLWMKFLQAATDLPIRIGVPDPSHDQEGKVLNQGITQKTPLPGAALWLWNISGVRVRK
ncbi:hypothetical protein JKG47_00405 [Acidithiobacillus sp. MC6.1]|nr:hypothetical protein [Acidithiobacillus sp. MC6.1]